MTVVCAIAACWAVTGPAQTQIPVQSGEDLFFGRAPMQAKPREHRNPLPAAVVRCANCHAGKNLLLNNEELTVPRQRRGGPPSAYDETKFCKVLHTGIDPAYIMIDHAMPIYDMPEADCAALWAYITRRKATDAHASH